MTDYNTRFKRFDFHLKEAPSSDLVLSIVIPSCGERMLMETLRSIEHCWPIEGSVEVIVVVNDDNSTSDGYKEINRSTLHKLSSEKFTGYDLHLVDATNLDSGGVGVARKIGMDLAGDRFRQIQVTGGIACLDADTTVSENYIVELERVFSRVNPPTSLSVYFEHPFDLDEQNRSAIIRYELFLRYFKRGLAQVGYAYPYYTVGSSMAVRSDVYIQQGGMNQRRAGEDFYFLSKIFPLGGHEELNSCTVYPSGRPSDRVPFGTGRDVANQLEAFGDEYLTYHPKNFDLLESLCDQIYAATATPNHEIIETYLQSEDWLYYLNSFLKNSSSEESLKSKCRAWLTPFRVMKFMHHARDNHLGQIGILEAMNDRISKGWWTKCDTHEEYLMQLRRLDQSATS